MLNIGRNTKRWLRSRSHAPESGDFRTQLEAVKALAPVDPGARRVLLLGTGRKGFAGSGKFSPDFLLQLCFCLQREGFDVHAIEDVSRLTADLARDAVTINLFNEAFEREPFAPDDALARRLGVALIFNSTTSGAIIGNKTAANLHLSGQGIPMPGMVKADISDRPVFSNEVDNSGAAVALLKPGERPDPTRYNTEFIDTRIEFRGRRYYTSIRLMCVGSEIIATLIGARDEAEGSPSVHNQDTPRDPDLIQYVQRELIDPLMPEFVGIARDICKVLGPGFYAHDIVVDVENRKPFVCEAGWKFNNAPYAEYMSLVAGYVDGLTDFMSPRFPRLLAEAFARECRRQGLQVPRSDFG